MSRACAGQAPAIRCIYQRPSRLTRRPSTICSTSVRSRATGLNVVRWSYSQAPTSSNKKKDRPRFSRPPPPNLAYKRADNGEAKRNRYLTNIYKFNILWAVFGLSAAGAFVYFNGWGYFADRQVRKEDGETSSLNPYVFSPYTLVSKQGVSPTCAIITLRPVHGGKGIKEWTERERTWVDRFRLSTYLIKRPKKKEDNKVNNEEKRFEAFGEKGIWSVEIKQPQLCISRRYTPLPPPLIDDGTGYEPGDIRLLVRRCPEGEVSGYLHSLQTGATVEIRGGYVEQSLSRGRRKKEDITDVIFVAGGTGIAPAFQVAHSLMRLQANSAESSADDGNVAASNAPQTRMRILWANRERADCLGGVSAAEPKGLDGAWKWFWRKASQKAPATVEETEKALLVQELHALETAQTAIEDTDLQVTTKYFVDEERTFISASDLRKAMNDGSREESNGSEHKQGRRLVIVSGPDGFVDYVTGSKETRAGSGVPGPALGLLSQVDHDGWEVWRV